MKFKALTRAMTAAIVTTASVAITVAAVERSLTVTAEPGHGTLAKLQEDSAAQA